MIYHTINIEIKQEKRASTFSALLWIIYNFYIQATLTTALQGSKGVLHLGHNAICEWLFSRDIVPPPLWHQNL